MDLPTCLCASLSTLIRAVLLPLHLLALAAELLVSCCRRAAPPPRHALITGAASGMGRALAVRLSRAGVRSLSLVDLNAAGLEETRELALAAAGAAPLAVTCAALNVCDRAAARAVVLAADNSPAAGPVDLVLACAGTIESRVGGGRGLDDLELGARAVIDVNVGGVANIVLPAVERMRARGAGRVGVLSSAAGRDGFSALYPAYAASKAFASAWALGLRAHLRESGVAVTVFEPGAVRTPLLQAPPGLDPHYDLSSRGPACAAHLPCVELSAEAAAAAFLAGVARDEAVARPHLTYGVCADVLLGFPKETHDIFMRNGCGLLWGWRPKKAPRHAWSVGAPKT